MPLSSDIIEKLPDNIKALVNDGFIDLEVIQVQDSFNVTIKFPKGEPDLEVDFEADLAGMYFNEVSEYSKKAYIEEEVYNAIAAVYFENFKKGENFVKLYD